MTEKITLAEVKEIAFTLVKTYWEGQEPIPSIETRQPNLLESCLDQPFVSFGGKDLYPLLIDKAAILFYLMNKNHPFKNGNKRLAVATLLVFLFKNEKWLDVDVLTMYEFAKSVAGSKAEEKEVTVKAIQTFVANSLVSLK